LQKGGGSPKKKKEKANIVADEVLSPEKAESANIVTESVSSELMKHIQAYISSDPNKQDNTIIIDSSATSHMTPYWPWFSNYETLKYPKVVNFGNDSTFRAVGTGSITLHTIIGKQTYEIILLNVLHILDLHLTLLSVSCFTQAGLSTLFLANTYTCEIQKRGKIILMGTHCGYIMCKGALKSQQNLHVLPLI
jgi:hypothetical protein